MLDVDKFEEAWYKLSSSNCTLRSTYHIYSPYIENGNLKCKKCFDHGKISISDTYFNLGKVGDYNFTKIDGLPEGHLDAESIIDYNLLEKAKQLYPVGTKFKSTFEDSVEYVFVVSGTNFDWYENDIYKKGEAIHEDKTDGLIYCKGRWAEIVVEEMDKVILENDLLKRAQNLYPVGTKFKTATVGFTDIFTVSGTNFVWYETDTYKKGEAIYEQSSKGLPQITKEDEWTPNVGDWVIITKSDRNWTQTMNEYVGKCVQITKTDKNLRIWFKEDNIFSWMYRDGHFRKAHYNEIPNEHFIKISPTINSTILSSSDTPIQIISPRKKRPKIFSINN